MSEIRIQDDLYEYVNHDWLENAVIPDDKPTAGGFADLDKGVEELLISDLNKMDENNSTPNIYLDNAVKLFRIAKDAKTKKRNGIKPVLKDLKSVYKLKNLSAFNRNLKEFLLSGKNLPFSLSVDTDMKDSTHHCVFLMGPETILPDSSYYAEERKQQKEMILGLWVNMAKAILSETKLSAEEQATFLADTLKFDEIIGGLVKSSEEMSEYAELYNPMKTRKVVSLLKPVKFKKLLEDLFGFVPEQVVVGDPRFLNGFKTLFNEENFEAYKHWAYVLGVISGARYGSEKQRELAGSYGRALSGISKMAPIEKFAYGIAGRYFSEPIGLYYGEKYFGEEAKKDVVDLTKQIIEKYKVRIKNNEILSDETKEKAILKLSKIEVKMGYPDKVKSVYDKLLIIDEEKSLYDNVCLLNRVLIQDNIDKIHKPVDRTEWGMPGHMVNASYNPFANDITFPAGILQAPFYSVKQSRSTNLGGIGAVIGHEISHAFDNNGALFDENGNLKNWWKKEDFKKFNKKTKAMIDEFDGIELPWGKVNGKFIVSENIADNGGMAVTLNIMKDMPDANYEEYFVNWAKVWCQKAKEEYRKLLLSVDVHAPTVLRANMQPRNFEEWYTTFNVTKKDKMYLDPKKRVIIW